MDYPSESNSLQPIIDDDNNNNNNNSGNTIQVVLAEGAIWYFSLELSKKLIELGVEPAEKRSTINSDDITRSDKRLIQAITELDPSCITDKYSRYSIIIVEIPVYLADYFEVHQISGEEVLVINWRQFFKDEFEKQENPNWFYTWKQSMTNILNFKAKKKYITKCHPSYRNEGRDGDNYNFKFD